MPIIFSYPTITTPKGSDWLVITDTTTSDSATKKITRCNLANYIMTTGTGTGTTDYILKWNDGPNGITGDSIIIERPAAGMFLSTYIETTDISIQKMEINSWLADSTMSTGNVGDVLTSTGGGVAATVTWTALSPLLPWPYLYDVSLGSIIQGSNPTPNIGDFDGNTGHGVGALAAMTRGEFNVAIGTDAMGIDERGVQCTAVGWGALANQNHPGVFDINDNTAFGYKAGFGLTGTGGSSYNTFIGSNCAGETDPLVGIYNGAYNTALGAEAMKVLEQGSNNVALGVFAMNSLKGGTNRGDYNIGIGRSALRNIVGTGSGASRMNIGIGTESGQILTDGSENICIGHESDASSATVDNEVSIYNGRVIARFQGAAAA